MTYLCHLAGHAADAAEPVTGWAAHQAAENYLRRLDSRNERVSDAADVMVKVDDARGWATYRVVTVRRVEYRAERVA